VQSAIPSGTPRPALSWLTALDPGTLTRQVGPGAVIRGAAYARNGAVTGLSVGGDGTVVLASVRGTRAAPYQVVVRALGDGKWSSDCSCPMGVDCKHVVAVLLTARDVALRGDRTTGTTSPGTTSPGTTGPGTASPGTGSTTPPTWERVLTDVFEPQDPAPDDPVPLALLVEVVEIAPSRWAGRPEAVPRARLRAARRGSNGAWIKTGASWRDLDMPGVGRPLHTRQRDALVELLRAARARQSVWQAQYGDPTVHLDELGPGGWRLLDDAVRAGVTLVSELGSRAGRPGARPVELAGGPADVTLDLRREVAADAVLAPVVHLPGQPDLPAHRVQLVGTPPHGLFVDDPARLLLAGFDRPLDAAVARLLSQRRPLTVPAADLPRFLARWYPLLRQRLPVGSGDASVDLPEIAPPGLGLAVRFGAAHRTSLRWSFRYPVDGRPVEVPINAASDLVARDTDAEEALLSGMDLLDMLDAVPALRVQVTDVVGPAHRLVPDVELTGIDTAVFVEQVLPGLRDRDDVHLTVEGDPADYAEAADAPLVSVSARESAEPGQTDWFDLGVSVSVAGQVVPLAGLLSALSRGESRMLLVSGTWFRLDRPELHALRAVVEEARALTDRPFGELRITPWQAGLWEELVSLGVVEHQSERWSRTVGALLDLDAVPTPPPPATLSAQLRPYQLQGYHWLSLLWDLRLGGVLADDMGLGKTVQTLAMVARAVEAGTLGGDAGPLLVVAPTSVVSTWVAQAARFCPSIRVAAVTETARRSGRALSGIAAAADVVVTSYALLRIDAEEYGAVRWSGLVLDEAQAVKNHQGKTYQVTRRIEAPFRLAVTGTPLENSLMDLWALLSLAAPGLFPSPGRFTETYRKPIENERSTEQLAVLRRRIRPLMLRRNKEQIATDLPPKVEQVLEVVLNPAHRRVYDRHLARERQRVLGLLDDMQRNRIAIFRSLTVLRQLSLDASLIDPDATHVRSSKIDALLDHLGEVVAEGHRVLVFSQFTRFLALVRDRLTAENIAHVYLDGRTRDRRSRIAAFTEGTAPVFLISLKAGGVGLTLTEADYVYVLDPWWNPATEAQAVDRAHRIGQDKTVMVYRLVAADTIEEKVGALQQHKRDLFARVVDGDGSFGNQLSADDIRGLFSA